MIVARRRVRSLSARIGFVIRGFVDSKKDFNC